MEDRKQNRNPFLCEHCPFTSAFSNELRKGDCRYWLGNNAWQNSLNRGSEMKGNNESIKLCTFHIAAIYARMVFESYHVHRRL